MVISPSGMPCVIHLPVVPHGGDSSGLSEVQFKPKAMAQAIHISWFSFWQLLILRLFVLLSLFCNCAVDSLLAAFLLGKSLTHDWLNFSLPETLTKRTQFMKGTHDLSLEQGAPE